MPPVLSLLLLLAPRDAAAFQVGAHRALSERAIDLELETSPALGPCRDAIAQGSVTEDYDLIAKWGRYSHYYSPVELVDTGHRLTSEVRVSRLWGQVEALLAKGDLDGACSKMGRVLHHIQDMASPPHVAPVVHSLSDGFESYAVDTMLEISTGDGSLPALPPGKAHHQLALDTLASISGGSRVACPVGSDWSAFWSPGEGPSFGDYGHAGNHFGRVDAFFAVEGGPGIAVAATPETERQRAATEAAFQAFARERIEAVLSYSRAYLRYAAERIEATSR